MCLYSVCTPLATVDSSNKVHFHAPDARAFLNYLLIDTKLLSVLSVNPNMYTVLSGNVLSDSSVSCGPEAILAVSSTVSLHCMCQVSYIIAKCECL